MYHVKTYNAIAPAGLATLSDQYRVNQPQAAPDAYMIRSVDLHEHDFPASLKVIARCGAGFNNIPLARASAAGIAVFNTPGGNANAVKELVLAMMIAANRNLIAAAEWTQQVAAGADITLEAKKSQFNGQEIAGKKLAVIGTGHVGSLVANAGEALGMEVVGYDPYLSVESAWNLSRNVHRAATLAEAVAGADFVTVHVPKNEETTGMIDAGLLAQLKPTAVLLNFARLGIVDNEAAVAALNAGRLRWYLTDFSDATLQGHPRVVILPHLGGSTVEAEANCAKLAAQELMTFLETGNVVNSVNLPNVSAPFASDQRLTLIHQNIPNMLGQISTVIANAGINIENLVNRSRGDYAYTMVDVASMPPTAAEGLVATLGQIEAVSRIRLLHR